MNDSNLNQDDKAKRAHELILKAQGMFKELSTLTRSLSMDKECRTMINDLVDNSSHVERKLHLLKLKAPADLEIKDSDKFINCYCMEYGEHKPNEPIIDVNDTYLTFEQASKVHSWLGEALKFYQELKNK